MSTEPQTLRDRIAEVLSPTVYPVKRADQVARWITDALMPLITAELDERDTRITELEEKFQGTLARRCDIPGCTASHDAETGPPPEETTAERHWLRKSSPSLLLCPDHSHLWEGATPHAPRLDYGTRSCACTCGHPLPGPTLGHMGTAWIAHALFLLAGKEPNDAHP